MTYRILAATALAVALAGISAAPALADSSYQCVRGKRVSECRYNYEGQYSTTTTYCVSGRRDSNCQTVTTPKPEPTIEAKLPEPPQQTPEGQVPEFFYGGIPSPNDPAELRRQREKGAREAAAAHR